MSTAAVESILPVFSIALTRVIENKPKVHEVYYTCTIHEKNSWSCVKGVELGGMGVDKTVVPVCKFQPVALQQKAVVKKLDSKDVKFLD